LDSTLKASGSQAFTLKSILCVLLVVGGVTGANIWWNPPRESPAPTPEYERLSDYGFSFSHLKGMNFTAVGPAGENATEDEGCLFGVLEIEDQPSEAITVIWNLTATDPCLEETLEGALAGLDNASYTRSKCMNSSRGDHELLYAFYNISDPHVGELSGIVGVWYCNLTSRIFTVHMVSPSVSTNRGDLQTRYQELMDYFGCHFYRPTRTMISRKGLFNVYDLITISVMVFLCIGFTFTYMMDGFLNFAHITYASIGGVVSSYLVRFWGVSSYDTWPFTALLGGFIGMFLYVALVRPIGTHARDWNREIVLTFSFWAVAMIIRSAASAYSYWNRLLMYGYSAGFEPRRSYFNWYGLSGSVFLGSVYCILLVVGLRLFLTRTRFGMALRATANDEKLAAILGINTFRVHLASWFISGALSALAGDILRMRGGGSDGLMINVMAGSIMGGLNNVYGGIIGGIFIAMANKTLKYLLGVLLGIKMGWWTPILPSALLWMVLILAPNGITRLEVNPLRHIHGLRVRLKRFKSIVKNLLKTV